MNGTFLKRKSVEFFSVQKYNESIQKTHMKDHIFTGLDIGSSSVKIVIGQKFFDEDKKSQLQIIGVAEHPTEGMNRGIVTSIEDLVASVSACVEKAERMAGVSIERAFVSISGSHIISQTSRGVIAVSRANGEINEDDVERVIEAAQTVATPPNYEILHVIPRTFMVDNQAGIKDPIGMIGVRLEVEAQIIQGLSSQIKNLTKSVYRTGIDIDDIVLSSLAAAESVLSKRQKELGVCLVTIGGSTTSMVVIEEGEVIHTAILPLGGGHITSDIAIGLRIPIDAAESIKLLYGDTVEEKSGKFSSEISLSEFGLGNETVLRNHVVEIINARLDEIFTLVDKELASVSRSGLLPAGVVLSGGGAKLKNITEFSKKKFKLPSSVGIPMSFLTPIEKINDPLYAVATGLVLWADHYYSAKPQKGLNQMTNFHSVSDWIKHWFRAFIP